MNAEHELQNCWKTSHFQTLKLDFRPLSLCHSCQGPRQPPRRASARRFPATICPIRFLPPFPQGMVGWQGAWSPIPPFVVSISARWQCVHEFRPRKCRVCHYLRRGTLRTGSAQFGPAHNNPCTTIDPAFRTNARWRDAGCSREQRKAGGVRVGSRKGDAIACLLCPCVASADRVWLGGQRRKSRWHLTERVGLCLSVGVHPFALRS
jgi:hypothetical protein